MLSPPLAHLNPPPTIPSSFPRYPQSASSCFNLKQTNHCGFSFSVSTACFFLCSDKTNIIVNLCCQLPASASFPTTHHHPTPPPFIHSLALCLPIRCASQASLQLALQADLCHDKTTRTLAVSAYGHANTNTNTRHVDLLLQMQQKCQQEQERGHARIQNDSVVPLSAGGLTKEFPLFFPQPSILRLSDPSSPSSCTLARGLTLKSGSLLGPNVINLLHSPGLFFTYNRNGLSRSPLKGPQARGPPSQALGNDQEVTHCSQEVF